MNPSGTRRTQLPLLLAVFSAVATVGFAVLGLSNAPTLGLEAIEPWIREPGRLIFHAVAVLAFEQPSEGPDNPGIWWSLARLGAAVFSVSTGLAVAFELEGLIRFTMTRVGLRLLGRPPAILLGLGWIGGPISATLRRAGRPVFAVATDEQSPLVTEARRAGILVLIGDATDPRTRDRLPMRRAREVFVATGDDALNVELAGNLLEASQRWRRREPLRCYVHITDPTFAETLGWQQIWAYDSPQLKLVPFSYPELAARDLFFGEAGIAHDPELRPTGQEPFHLVIVGFGFVGRTVARYVARFAHFASEMRPRLTVLDANDDEFRAFLERYPAFSPSGLDLASAPLRAPGSDAWDGYVGRPDGKRHQVQDGDAVEYAVHAEFSSLPGDLAAESLTERILQRAAPLDADTPVRMAVVVCLDGDRASFEAALRIQHALASGLHDRPAEEHPKPIPIYVHLPERGLATVLAKTDAADWLSVHHQKRDRDFPVRVFGVRDIVASYELVTAEKDHRQATGAKELYALLSPRRAAHDHIDFATSNLDASLHAEIKCAALGIEILPAKTPPPSGAVRVLAPLFERQVETAVSKLQARHDNQVPHDLLATLDPEVRERLVLQGNVSSRPSTGDVTDDVTQGDDVLLEILDDLLARFRTELTARGHDADLPAKMEHNRWMGERLLKGWRFGPRNDISLQRESMVPWERVAARDRRHDAVSLPRFVVEAHREGLVAWWPSAP